MVVGTSRDQRKPPRQQFLRQCLCIADDLGRVFFELRGRRLFQGNADGGGGVVVRTALQTGKYRAIDGIRHFLTAQNHRAARSTQGLVGGGGYHIGVGNRVGVDSAHDQPRDVRNIGEQVSAHFFGDLAKRPEIDAPWIGRRARHDDARTLFFGHLSHHVIVDAVGLAVDSVLHRTPEGAGDADVPAVGQMPSHGERKTHDRFARFQEAEVNRKIGRRTRIRLHVDMFRFEQCLGTLDHEGLQLVDVTLALVVTAARVALGVLVGENRAGSLHHRLRSVVLGRNEPDGLVFVSLFFTNYLVDFRVGSLKIVHTAPL